MWVTTALACCAHDCLTGRNIADPLGSMTRFLPSSSRSSFSVSVFVVLLALAAIVVGITLMYRGQVGLSRRSIVEIEEGFAPVGTIV